MRAVGGLLTLGAVLAAAHVADMLLESGNRLCPLIPACDSRDRVHLPIQSTTIPLATAAFSRFFSAVSATALAAQQAHQSVPLPEAVFTRNSPFVYLPCARQPCSEGDGCWPWPSSWRSQVRAGMGIGTLLWQPSQLPKRDPCSYRKAAPLPGRGGASKVAFSSAG